MIVWVWAAFAASEAELYRSCEAGDVAACRSFLAAAARAALRSETRDPVLETRWRSMLEGIRFLPTCRADAEYPVGDCARLCRSGAQGACETLVKLDSVRGEGLVLVQQLCDTGNRSACAAIERHGIAAIDGLGDSYQVSRSVLTAEGALVEVGSGGTFLAQRHHFRHGLSEGMLVRARGGDWIVHDLGDRLVGGPPGTPDRVWDRPSKPCGPMALTDDDAQLLVVAGARCDQVLVYARAGGPVERTLPFELVVDDITAGPDGGFVVRQSGEKGIRSLDREGKERWSATAKDHAEVRSSVSAGRLVSSNHYQCAIHDLKTGKLVEETHGACDIDESLLAIASRGIVVRDLAAGSSVTLPLAGGLGFPRPVVDGVHRRVAVPGGPIVTLKGGERPRSDAIGHRVYRYERAKTTVSGTVTDASRGVPAEVTVYLVVGDLLEPNLSAIATVPTSPDGSFTVSVPAHRPVVLEARANERTARLWWTNDDRERAAIDLARPGPDAPVIAPCDQGCPALLERLGEQVAFYPTDGLRYRELSPRPVPVHAPLRTDPDHYFVDALSHRIDLYFGRRLALDGRWDPGEVTVTVRDAGGRPARGVVLVCEDAGVRYVGHTDAEGHFRSGPDARCGLAAAPTEVEPWANHLGFARRTPSELAAVPRELQVPAAAIAGDVEQFADFDPVQVLATGPWKTPDGSLARLADLYGDREPDEPIGPGIVKLQLMTRDHPSLRLGQYLVFVSEKEVWVVPGTSLGGDLVRLIRE